MAEKETPKKDSSNFFGRDIDPAVEAHVIEVMESHPNAVKPVSTTSDEPDSTPLLPSDKLPNEVKADPQSQSDKEVISEPKKAELLPAQEPPEGLDIDNPETDKAVDDIVNKDSDRMLAIEDAKAELLNEGAATLSIGPFSRFKMWLADLFASRGFRVFLAVMFLGITAALIAVPESRYFILNTAGVRSSTSMTVLDASSGQPVKNVKISIGDQSASTDIKGYAKVERIKQGSQELIIEKPAYATSSEKKTFGWGSNQLGEIRLMAVGSQYSFTVVDFLSGKPVKGVEAVSGEASAVANEKGEVSLVVEDNDKEEVDIEIKAPNYRTEKLTMPVGKQEMKKINLVPSRKHAFVSKREGTFDLYKSDVDGKNEEVVLAGTGNEQQDNIALLHHPSRDLVAFVSTRSQSRSSQGDLLTALNVVDLKNNESNEVTESQNVQLIDFIGNKLIYVQQNQNAKDDADNRHSLMTYDVDTRESKELARANYFNDVVSAQGTIYFSPADNQSNSEIGFIKIKPDGSSRENIFNKEIFNIYRSSYDKLTLAVGTDWYEFDLTSGQLNKLDGAPASRETRIYTPNPSDSQSAWVDQRDGKGVLIIYDHKTGNDKVIRSVGGLSNPVRWLDDTHLVYRVKTNAEVADYVLSLGGGESVKIADVTDTAGLDRWYYY